MLILDSFKDTCYVIMPFSETTLHSEEYWTNHFEFFLKPFIEKRLKMNARRSEALVGDIVNKIITDLTGSSIVIADITEFNPNVLWELGVRHSFVKNGTVLIAEKKNKIPFDLLRESTHFYFDHCFENPETKKFFDGLESAVKKCRENPTKIDSPVFVTISGRGTMHEVITRDETIRKLNAILMEFEDNLEYMGVILEMVKENRKIRKENKNQKRSISVVCMRYTAMEFLIAEQYLNQPLKFYKTCRNYLNWLMGTNQTIVSWEYDDNNPEKWFIKNFPSIKKETEELRKQIMILKTSLERMS